MTFLLPLAFIAAGVALVAVGIWLWRALPEGWRRPQPRRALLGAAVVALVLLIAYPLRPLARYYTHEAAKDPANASILATVAFIEANRDPRTPLIIGRKFSSVDLKDGADLREIFDLLFDLNGTPHGSPHNTHAEIERVVRAAPPGDREALPLIIMMRDECWQMRDRRPFPAGQRALSAARTLLGTAELLRRLSLRAAGRAGRLRADYRSRAGRVSIIASNAPFNSCFQRYNTTAQDYQ